MRTNNYLTLVLVILSQFSIGQTLKEKELHGKINVDSNWTEGINIVNSSNQKATISDKNGFFGIAVNEGDILIFSAVNLETLRKIISKQDLIPDVISIDMHSKSNELKEVIINAHPEINAVSLGISAPGTKHYTPAERRLKTAGDFKPIHLLGLLGGSVAVDPILNAISGRTTMLKKEVKVEKNELYILQLDNMFDKHYFVDILKIPLEYVKGFEYYIIENDKFINVLNSKNKIMTEFLMTELATKYNEIIACENE